MIATDSTTQRSFAIFLYADGRIQWTTGDDDGGTNGLGGKYAQVGFNKGNGIDFSVVPESQTADVIDMDKYSNVGKPGVWIFEISREEIPVLQSKIISMIIFDLTIY